MKIGLYVLAAVATILTACDQKQLVNSKRYSVEVNTWGFGAPSFSAFMYNTGYETYPRNRRGKGPFDENTLYIVKTKYSEDKDTTDTLKISLSSDEVDSLYSLAHRFVSDFEIDNRVEVRERVTVVIHDGASLKVALGYEGKLIECTQYHLEGVSYSSLGGHELVKFINKRAKEGFWLY